MGNKHFLIFFYYNLRPLTHVPESGSRNQLHNFRGQIPVPFLFVSMHDLHDWLPSGPKGSQWCYKSCISMKNCCRNLASNSGLWYWFLQHVSGASWCKCLHIPAVASNDDKTDCENKSENGDNCQDDTHNNIRPDNWSTMTWNHTH